MSERVILDEKYQDSKPNKVLTIFFDEEQKSCQRVQLSSQFGGDYFGLVEHLTKSDRKKGIKNYHSFNFE